jgi:hypothetical protein
MILHSLFRFAMSWDDLSARLSVGQGGRILRLLPIRTESGHVGPSNRIATSSRAVSAAADGGGQDVHDVRNGRRARVVTTVRRPQAQASAEFSESRSHPAKSERVGIFLSNHSFLVRVHRVMLRLPGSLRGVKMLKVLTEERRHGTSGGHRD